MLKKEKFLKEFGLHLRSLRRAKMLSQEHLAIDADIPTNQIGRIERGEISTSITTLLKIAQALDIEIIDFFKFGKNRIEHND